MKQKQIFLNAFTTFAQELASAAILFLLYRFLIRAIGIERFGIWSIILASTSVVALANQGLSTSVVKFVAKYAAQDKSVNVSVLIQTAMISMGLALAVISIGLYPGAKWILKFLLPSAALREANQVLPFALISLWINVVGSILLAGLTGLERVSHRNYVVLGGSVVFLVLAYILVPGHGLLGLAYAQTAQAIACLFTTWILLRQKLPHFPAIPHRWDRELFREMRYYGTHFQFITMSQAVREPVTKVLLARFGGLAITGYYDIASRWVVSFRELLVQANQVLVPTVSRLKEREPSSLPALYRESYRLIFYLAVPTFSFVVIAAPLVSRVWIGSYQSAFVNFVGLLAAGWLVNVLANPAYVFDLGTGALRWVSIGCAATGILNAGLGFMLGARFGATAVVAVSASTLALGYTIILIAYHVQNRASFAVLAPRESVWIVLFSTLALFVLLPAVHPPSSSHAHSIQLLTAASGLLLAMIGIPMWVHPLRKRLMNWALSRQPA